jgi:signal transduction histidine kinase/DNA-binding response OmpR family regulator
VTTGSLLTVRIQREIDIVGARQRARQIAATLGFESTEQTRIATAVSELARNAFQYAGGGSAEYRLEGTAAPQVLSITVSDKGPGIADVERVLGGDYRSETGMGLGIVGTRRLMDAFQLSTSPNGTTVTIKKLLPRRAPLLSEKHIGKLAASLTAQGPDSPIEEVQRQNQELLRTLDELRARQEDLERVNRELEDTNRGVVALYAELDERAEHLRRADELKTRFLSNMTHEFRTPVNSILALTSLLADRLEAPPDHKDEVFYIRKSAQQLSDIVDDLLDIAKVEAGKIVVRPAPFEVGALFGALRGVLRPLLLNQSLNLTFEAADDLPPILSDESKVSQILRNFISNALKYTERGEVRVTAALTPERDAVQFTVTDTGIGIPERDLTRVFDEFAQIENPLQKRVKGTGLGLPLSKRLAELLGGSIGVHSTLGLGSTFWVKVPLVYRDIGLGPVTPIDASRMQVLVVEDNDEDLLIYERMFATTHYQVMPARTVTAAISTLEAMQPAAIVLDLRLQGQESWDFLAKLKRDAATRAIPVVVVSTIDDRQKGFALGADAYAVKPIDRDWLLATLDALVKHKPALRVLTVDDEETFRYIIREMLNGPEFEVVQAGTGRDGLRLTREVEPDIILLDLRLTDMTGVDLCEQLRDDPHTAKTPVLIVTSQRLTADETQRLGAGSPVLSKAQLTRDTLRSAIRDAVDVTQE